MNKQEGFVTARTGSSKVKVTLEERMPTDRYHVSASIIEPKRDERPEDLTMEILPGKTDREFTIQFNMKLESKIKIVYIAEHA